MIFTLSLALSLALPSPQAPPSVQNRSPQNIILIIADDLGVDMLAFYGKGGDVPVTPNIDSLANSGVMFRNAWAAPLCSPTRACIQTGRYGFRTGIGLTVKDSSLFNGLPTSEVILPEMLDAGSNFEYQHAFFGKWHLNHVSANDSSGAPVGPNSPLVHGYNHFEGTLHNIVAPETYFNWTKITNGVKAPAGAYATTAVVDDFIAWKAGITEPYFAILAFHAPHTPYHKPPPAFITEDLNFKPPPGTNPRPYFKGMVEAMDYQLGRLIQFLAPSMENTTIIFMGDNGTPGPIIADDPNQLFDSTHGKGRVYEKGVNVPLIVVGPNVTTPGTECVGMVSAVDLFATVAELANVDLSNPAIYPQDRELDSVSLVPYLADPGIASLRRTQYTERFFENTKTAAQPDKSQFKRQHLCQEEAGFASHSNSARLILCGKPPVHNTENQSTIWLEGAPANAEVFLLAGGFKPFANPLYDDLITVSTKSFKSLLMSNGKLNLGISFICNDAGSLTIPGFIHQKSSPQNFYLQAAVQDPITLEWSLSNALFIKQNDNVKALRSPDGYKLVSYVSGGQQELFYLPDDSDEQTNLLALGVNSLTPAEALAYKSLRQAMLELLASEQ